MLMLRHGMIRSRRPRISTMVTALFVGLSMPGCSADWGSANISKATSGSPNEANESSGHEQRNPVAQHSDLNAVKKELFDAAQARQRWQQQANSYSFVAAQQCYCLPSARAPRLITVSNDRITGISFLDSCKTDPNPPQLLQQTITQWFDYLQQQSRQENTIIKASFDAVTGFPLRIYVDRHPRIADDELSVEFSHYKSGSSL